MDPLQSVPKSFAQIGVPERNRTLCGRSRLRRRRSSWESASFSTGEGTTLLIKRLVHRNVRFERLSPEYSLLPYAQDIGQQY